MTRDALVVGINSYEYANGLKSPAKNAEAIAQVLEQAKFKVKRLPRSKKEDRLCVSETGTVSRKHLKEAIRQLFQPPEETIPQTALLFFSGHGLREDVGVSEGYLATSDANPELGAYGVRLGWLRELLNESPVKEQLVWLDCCYSGELLNFQENLYEARLGQRKGYSRCFIAASREDEKALGNVTSPYGELTSALLKGLNPANTPNGWLTSAILTEAVNRFLTIGEQHPIAYNFGNPIILTTGKEARQSKDRPPYKGLKYFTQKDADLFYGRTALTDKLLQKVDESNFVALLGASGSGKSSVLRAGLLHQLSLGQKISGSHTWQLYEPFTPGEHPLESLEKAIGRKADELEALIAEATAKRVVITVDQFEECFTLCEEKQERQQFFDFLLNAVARLGKKFCLLLGIRADFLGKCLEYPYLAQYIDQNQVLVAPMIEKELKEAIKEPAKQVNLQVEESLINQLLEDVRNSPGSLPLLQYTLDQLWEARKEPAKDWLTLASYEQLGGKKRGIKGILEKRANEVYNNLLSTEERPVAKYIFLSLTQLNEDAEDTRKRKRIADLVTSRYSKDLINEVLQKLTDERLIVTRISETDSGNLAVVDVAHEILIREWELLRGWINENRKFLIQQKEIEAAAEEWQSQKNKKKKDYLIRGKRLREARKFQKEQKENYPLSELAETFIARSIKHQRREIIKSLVLFGPFLIAFLIGIFSGFYYIFREIQLNPDRQLIQDCVEQKDCHGRIEALERLVNANESLSSYNLRGADLRVANLRRADLNGADLRGVYLKNTIINEKTKLNDKWRFVWEIVNQGANGQDLSSANLDDANLWAANLGYANLGSANLRRAILWKANLWKANLGSANLESANLAGAYLGGANLGGANLGGANLKSANLKSAYLIEVQNLISSQIKSACYWETAFYIVHADKEKQTWIVDEEDNQQYIDKLKQDKASDPQEPVDCSVWEQSS